MVKVFTVIISFLILNGCNTQRNLIERNLKEDVQKNWTYNNELKYNSTNRAFTNKLDSVYKDLLIGKDTSYISGMFGSHYIYEQPHEGWLVKQFPTGMRYNLSAPCSGTIRQSDCPYFFFYLDKKGKVGMKDRVDLMLLNSE